MFIEFETKDDKRIFYNVNNVVFVGEMADKVSIMFDDGTHAIYPDEYMNVAKKFIELSKIVVDSSMYVQFTTRKDERIAFPIKRIFYALEEEDGTAIMFNDGTRIEITEEIEMVIKRIIAKLDIGVERPNNTEKIKS